MKMGEIIKIKIPRAKTQNPNKSQNINHEFQIPWRPFNLVLFFNLSGAWYL